jgi:hypothetical protein
MRVALATALFTRPVSICVYVRACIYVCVCMYVYIYMYIYSNEYDPYPLNPYLYPLSP